MSSEKNAGRKQTLDAAVRYFAEGERRVKVRGNLQLQAHLETIKAASEEAGIKPDHITALLDAAASGHFAQSVSRQLIRSLIPSTRVPQEAVVKAISWMSTNKPPVAIQCLLLRWILVVYDHIDGYDKLHALYGILFLFLDSQLMLPHVCHLMFLLTRKEDVKMFRVRKLLSLIQGRVGPQPCLLGLLTIYKLYYPNLVSFSLPASNKMFFGSFDRKWKAQVREIVEKSAAQNSGSLCAAGGMGANSVDRGISKSRQLTTRPPAKKRRKLTAEIPMAHNASAETLQNESTERVSVSVSTNRVPFVRVDTFIDLIDNVEKVEFPSQIAACLRDPILQHLMAYTADKVVTARFMFWLQDTLMEEFLNHASVNVEENERLLKMLVDFTDFLQEGIPVVDSFLGSYLHTWNGMDYAPLILRLITKCQMYPFNDLNDLILEPLRQLFFSSSVYFKCQCILTLTELLRNYAAYECSRLREWNAAIAAESQTTTLQSFDPSLLVLYVCEMAVAVCAALLNS